MTFQEAVEQGYTIFVANGHIADDIVKRHKVNRFKVKSIKWWSRLDGIRYAFIDENLKYTEEAQHIERLIGYKGGIRYGSIPPG